MRANPTNCSPHCRAAATLVEVVAGLALMASLLVAPLLAQSRYTRQSAAAERRLQTVAAADALLAAWWEDRPRFPRSSSGWVGGADADLSWRTQVVGNPPLEEWAAEVVRLEVVDEPPRPTAGRVLVSVDVVLDEPRAGAGTGEAAMVVAGSRRRTGFTAVEMLAAAALTAVLSSCYSLWVVSRTGDRRRYDLAVSGARGEDDTTVTLFSW